MSIVGMTGLPSAHWPTGWDRWCHKRCWCCNGRSRHKNSSHWSAWSPPG